MKCLSCGLEAGFKRLVVHTDADETEGSLCSSCESKLRQLSPAEGGDEGDGDDGESGYRCRECGEAAAFALPEMQLSVDEETDGDGFVYGYDIDAETPRLCTDHLESILASTRRVDPLNMLDDEI